MMPGSAYLGHLGPIPVYFHWTAILMLVLVWTGFSPQGLGTVILATVVLLIGILLHEMGHGMTARAFGARGITITLWAFGGLCASQRDSDRPGREFLIVAAGPAVSFALCGIGWLGMEALHRDAVANAVGSWGETLRQLAVLTFWINLWMGAFNLLPIFPLDGGQLCYQGMRLLRVPHRTNLQLCLTMAVVGAFAYVGWRAYLADGQLTQGVIYAAVLMAFLLWEAWNYLR